MTDATCVNLLSKRRSSSHAVKDNSRSPCVLKPSFRANSFTGPLVKAGYRSFGSSRTVQCRPKCLLLRSDLQGDRAACCRWLHMNLLYKDATRLSYFSSQTQYTSPLPTSI